MSLCDDCILNGRCDGRCGDTDPTYYDFEAENDRRDEYERESDCYDIMKHIADDASEGEDMSIQFYKGSSNPAVYTPTTDWDKPGADILGDIFAVAEMLAAKGLPASDLLVSPDVGDAILHDETILKLLDNRNVNVGGIDPQQLPAGVTKIARLNAKGHVVDVLQYSASYTDDEDKEIGRAHV